MDTRNYFQLCPCYKGKPLIPVQSTRGGKNILDELVRLRLDLFDVKDIAEHGYDCEQSKRRKGVVEKCIDKKRKTIKVVLQQSYCFTTPVWEVIHVGEFTRKK